MITESFPYTCVSQVFQEAEDISVYWVASALKRGERKHRLFQATWSGDSARGMRDVSEPWSQSGF